MNFDDAMAIIIVVMIYFDMKDSNKKLEEENKQLNDELTRVNTLLKEKE